MKYLLIIFFTSLALRSFAQEPIEPVSSSRGNIDIINFKDIFKIYPSPAQGFINIDKLPESDNSILITNLLGQIVKRFDKLRGLQRIEIDDLSSGSYVIVLLSYDRIIYSVQFLKA